MDSHEVNGVTSSDVAKAHMEDLKIQHIYGCKALTYWFDEDRGSAFCLIEAPSKEAVIDMHNNAHGLTPTKIVEVDEKVVEAFLGRIVDPNPIENTDENGLLIINDPAFRVIVSIKHKETPLLTNKFGKTLTDHILKTYNELLNSHIVRFSGRKIENVNQGMLISFKSVKNAIECANGIYGESEKEQLLKSNNCRLNTGISAGVPVTENDEFFGETVIKANLLRDMFYGNNIVISSSIREYISNEELAGVLNKTNRILSDSDEVFLVRLNSVVDRLWNNPKLTIDMVSLELGISKSQIYRKMKAILGISLKDFITNQRMNRSLKLLTGSQNTISEVAYDSGFNSASYYSNCFREYFQCSPTDVIGAV